MLEDIRGVFLRVRSFEEEAHSILGVHETSPSRIILLESTYKRLGRLSLRQDELFKQSLRCAENGLFRAAHVMAWAGFIDFLEEKLASDGFILLRAARPNWKFKTIEDLREQVPEYQLIEACRDVGLCTKNEVKSILGLLNKRNECAHPSDYFPGLNETLGFISELIQRVDRLSGKNLNQRW